VEIEGYEARNLHFGHNVGFIEYDFYSLFQTYVFIAKDGHLFRDPVVEAWEILINIMEPDDDADEEVEHQHDLVDVIVTKLENFDDFLFEGPTNSSTNKGNRINVAAFNDSLFMHFEKFDQFSVYKICGLMAHFDEELGTCVANLDGFFSLTISSREQLIPLEGYQILVS